MPHYNERALVQPHLFKTFVIFIGGLTRSAALLLRLLWRRQKFRECSFDKKSFRRITKKKIWCVEWEVSRLNTVLNLIREAEYNGYPAECAANTEGTCFVVMCDTAH